MDRKYIFLDSFIFMEIGRDNKLRDAIKSYILSNHLTLVIGVMNLIEVYKWKRYWSEVSDLISSVPFCIAENAERIADFEVSNYPNRIELPTSFCSSDF